MMMLCGGRQIPHRKIAAIPHTTAALTDRATAFDEGFGIHLETVAAHVNQDAETRDYYDHRQLRFADLTPRGEYYRQVADLLTYSQNLSRYFEVRENYFAFESAWQEPDYLRVQLEKSRDFATLRNANQLLQSEGFAATVFFYLRDRQAKVLNALAEMFATKPFTGGQPWLLHFISTYAKLYPDEAAAVHDVLLDLSHGVFVDPGAAGLWKQQYLAALRLDVKGLNLGGIAEARKRWRELAKDPAAIYSRLGPQIPCRVKGVTVLIAVFGRKMPVGFDVNTVQKAVIGIVPGITPKEIDSWALARDSAPFKNADDFRSRSGLSASSLEALQF
jgi:hypothetical protein